MDIEQLLYEEEGTSLDFKRESYKFINASDHQKSELLKDILAFANAWRRNTAYILLGVEETKGGRSTPIGMNDELDDAQLQEFINKKTQRPITFTYRTQTIDNLKVGVIEIPEQKRPIYLTKDYGKLKRNIVYIRRGSSTDEAPPDEIMEMAQAKIEKNLEIPELLLQLADVESEDIIGTEQKITPVLLDMSRYKEIGDFVDRDSTLNSSYLIYDPYRETARPDYFRKLALYEFAHAKTESMSFCITNLSKVSVTDISVDIIIEKDLDKFSLMEPSKLPREPISHDSNSILSRPHMLSNNIANHFLNKDKTFDLEELSDVYRIKLTFRKVQPKQTIFCDDFICVSASDNFACDANVSIYADNLPEPKQLVLKLNCTITKKKKLFEGLPKESSSSGFTIRGLKE